MPLDSRARQRRPPSPYAFAVAFGDVADYAPRPPSAVVAAAADEDEKEKQQLVKGCELCYLDINL